MTVTTSLRDKIAAFLAGESVVRNWNFAIGTGTGTATQSDTAMITELDRTPVTMEYNNKTSRFSRDVFSAGTDFVGETISEDGVLDSTSSGSLIAHTTDFEPILMADRIMYTFINQSDVYPSIANDQKLITDTGCASILSYLSGGSNVSPSHIAYGAHLIIDQCDATTGWTGSTDATAAATSTNKQEGVYSLALGKSGTSSTLASYTKTTTSLTATAATALNLYLRWGSLADKAKLATSNGIEIRFGQDSSNYYRWYLQRDDLYIGWTLHSLLFADAVSVGSPSKTAMDYSYIGLTTTNASDTITAGSLLMDYWYLSWDISATETTLHQEIIRKAVTDITRNASSTTFETIVGASEGNTYDYVFCGLFNAASSGTMYYVEKIFLIKKDSLTQVNALIEIGVTING